MALSQSICLLNSVKSLQMVGIPLAQVAFRRFDTDNSGVITATSLALDRITWFGMLHHVQSVSRCFLHEARHDLRFHGFSNAGLVGTSMPTNPWLADAC